MKKTLDDKEVPDRCYYYLLDWNEVNRWFALKLLTDARKLNELTYDEFWILFNHAVKKDLNKFV